LTAQRVFQRRLLPRADPTQLNSALPQLQCISQHQATPSQVSMKRTASLASLTSSEQEAKRLHFPRMQLEALAQEALREGLSKEQVAYEKWVDTQPIEGVVAWDEMGVGERTAWVVEYMESRGGEGDGEPEVGKASDDTACADEVQRVEEEQTAVEHTSVEERREEAVGDLGEESRWRAVRTAGREDTVSHAETMVVVEQEESSPILPGMFFCSRSKGNIRFKWKTSASDLGYRTARARLGLSSLTISQENSQLQRSPQPLQNQHQLQNLTDHSEPALVYGQPPRMKTAQSRTNPNVRPVPG